MRILTQIASLFSFRHAGGTRSTGERETLELHERSGVSFEVRQLLERVTVLCRFAGHLKQRVRGLYEADIRWLQRLITDDSARFLSCAQIRTLVANPTSLASLVLASSSDGTLSWRRLVSSVVRTQFLGEPTEQANRGLLKQLVVRRGVNAREQRAEFVIGLVTIALDGEQSAVLQAEVETFIADFAAASDGSDATRVVSAVQRLDDQFHREQQARGGSETPLLLPPSTTSMSHRLSQNARHTNDLLEELERDKELEVLREYLTRFDLFPGQRDPAAAPIRFEELKELVKHWKLHRQRNFWKTHTTKEDLVRTLYRHINTKIIPQETRDESSSSTTITTTAAINGASSSGATTSSIAHGGVDSPRSKSILVHARGSTSAGGPKREHIFSEYGGDLFSQRGDYEDGMIYLSRFQKPGLDADRALVKASDSASELEPDDDEEEAHSKSQDELDLGSALSREVRLKQECAFSIYHFTTDVGNEKQLVHEGCMLALSRLSVFDDIEVKKLCAAAILNLTWEASLCLRMLEEGVLLALLELAKAQHEEIRRNTSMALCRFSYERRGQLRLVQEGCVSAIVSMLNSPDYETKEACVKALVNIASSSGAGVADSVVQTILKISARKELASVSFAAEAICNLSLLSGPRGKVVEDGILENLCELSQSASSDADVKLNLATALANFSGCPSNLEHLSQVRILECLEDLLKVEHELVRERCAFTIANVSSHAASLKSLVLSDAVVQLVGMGQKASETVQESIALSLSNMSSTPDSRQLLGRFGVVSLLLHFLDDASAATKQYAIVSLCSLMVTPATCSELMQNNTPAVLARLATSAHDKVRELCANALFNLSCDKSLHGYLLKDDVIKAVARLCKRFVAAKDGADTVTEDEPPAAAADKTPVVLLRAQECAIACLFNLSFFEESRKVLTRVDVVKTLFQLFQRPVKSEELLKQCAGIVANLSFDADARARMVEDGCVRLTRKLMSASSKDTLLCCAVACCNVAAEALEKTPVLAMLIDLSGSPHAAITLTCAIAFAKLASAAAFRPALARCAELYPALTLMMRCGIEDIQIYSAVALCNLAVERSARSRHIWKEGTVPDFIVNSLLRINSDSTKEICARALYNLLSHDEFRAVHIKEGVLYALVKLARLESVEIRSLCVAALYNLSCDPAMLDVLMEINVAQVITKMCEIEFSSQDIHRRLAACLMNIAMKPGTEVKLVEGGALVATLVLAEHNDAPTMRCCASVLCYLSSQRATCEAMAASGLVDVLARMVAADDSQQNLFGLHALCNISCVPVLHDRVVEDAAVVPPTLRLFAASDDDDVLLGCAQTLYNLAHHARFRRTLLQADLLGALQVVFSRGPALPPLVDVCVQIVAILCEDPQDWGELAAGGAVKVLRVVAPRCSPAAMLHCIFALSQLARGDKVALAVLTDGALDVLASAVLPSPAPVATDSSGAGVAAPPHDVSPDLAERCSLILRSLSTSLECLPALTEDRRLIAIIRAITADGARKDTCRNAILTLYNVTSCRSAALDSLVALGVVRVLIRLSTVGGADMAPACAIALAHIKHTEKDREQPAATSDGTAAPEPPDEMEEGIMTTLLAMIDLDQASIHRVERTAATLPANLPPLRPAEWVFIAGNTSIRLGSQLPVSWAVHNSSIDDARFVPAEPRSFLSMLAPVVPATGVTVQDKLSGSFRVMKVRDDKYRIKRLDARFLAQAAGGAATDSRESLSDAISAAIVGSERSRASASSLLDTSDSGSAHDAHASDSESEEVRSPSPAKKKSSTLARGGISRANSHGRNMGALLLDRRGSKTNNHKGSKTALQAPDAKPDSHHMRKKESQRNSKLYGALSSDSDRGVILPRL
ncbi:hypothetical protein PybrP1_012509 [[Pythium] brassicae (nom. inval.)]|nr:hypothetical protein PybrP1_012509 [[Pythium] brassicae (nom. inval.)]